MKKLSLLATSVAIALTGCGGSDDDSKQPVETGRITITAMDGYIQKALICADENNNGTCEVTEVITDLNDELLLTDAKGQINASITIEDQNRLANSPRLITTVQSVFPNSDIQTIDIDMPSVAMKAVTLRAPAGSEIVSPITDLVVAKMTPASVSDTGLSKEEAEQEVLASLSGLSGDEELTTDLLYSNYIETKENSEDASAEFELAAKIHKTAQILTETKANASSDKAFDKALDTIVSSTVSEVETISVNDLTENTYKPYVPVTDAGAEKLIKNYLAKFDAEKIGDLNTLLGETDHYGDVSLWLDIDVAFEMTSLVKDDDTTASTIIVVNEKSLADKNLTVTITDAGLTVTRSDSTKAVSKGQYDIILATTDINSNGDEVKGTVKATDALKLNIKSYNNAPEASENGTVAQEIQTQLSNLTLEKDAEMAQTTFDFNGLFSDEDGDALSYSAEVTLPGLTAEVSGTNVILSGTPKASLDNALLTITAQETDTEEKYSTSVDFTLPKATVTQTSELKDILVNSSEPWYRWSGDTEYSNNVVTGAQNCMGMIFQQGDSADEGEVLFAEGKECPSPEQITEQDGTWRVGDNGEVIWSFDDISEDDDEVAITLSGLIDRTDDVNQPRIVSFELETQATMTYNAARQRVLSVEETGRGVTFYQGVDAAQHYWNFNEGYAWVANKEIKVDLTAVHGQFTEYEQDKHIDVDMYFNDISCEDLGFKLDTDNSRYIVDNLRAEDFTIYSEGFSGQVIQFSEESWHETPYAFAGQDDDGSQYCAVNLAVSNELGLNTQAGQSLTVHYSPKDSNTDEEFIVNTFIDRDVEIQPEENLVIDEQGIYTVDGRSVSHIYKDSDGIIREIQTSYYGEWSDWGEIDENQTITQYTAYNGNLAYQFWNGGYSADDAESFTIWSDTSGELMFKDAGNGEAESAGELYVHFEEAQTVVEANAEPMVFTDTTWSIVNSKGESQTVSFTDTHITFGNEAPMLRTDLPMYYLGCLRNEADTCFAGIAIGYPVCDETDSYHGEICFSESHGWFLDSTDQFRYVYGEQNIEETWTRQY